MNAYFAMSVEDCKALNLSTWDRIRINGETVKPFWVGFAEAVALLGCRLVVNEKVFARDEEGRILADEKGEPIVESQSPPAYSFEVNVGVEGLKDCDGHAIPKGKQKFLNTLQDNNRPLTESNFKNLRRRMLKWLLNGETMIQGVGGKGLNLQHRCTCLVYHILMGGKNGLPADLSIPVLLVTGIPLEAGQTIDTGKSNTGKDTFGRDPNLCPIETLRTRAQYNGVEGAESYGSAAIAARKTITGEVEGVAKLLVLRLAGKNINASIPGGGNEATELAYDLLSVIPSLGEAVAMTHAYIDTIDRKARPSSITEIATALILSQLGEHEPMMTIAGPGATGTPMADYETIELDLQSMQAFLEELCTSTGGIGMLGAWYTDRMAKRKLDHKIVKFAQLCRAIRTFNGGEAVTATINEGKGNTGASGKDKEEASYTCFGGADRGKIAKKVKGEASEE